LNLRLTANAENRTLEPKSFRLLQFLIENRDRAVSKDEIFQAIWPDVTVTDNALTRAVGPSPQGSRRRPQGTAIHRDGTTVDIGSWRLWQSALWKCRQRPRSHGQRSGILLWPYRGSGPGRRARSGVFLSPRRGPTSLSSAQLTSGEGLDICAAFSPAGNVAAYASDRSGSFEIYARLLDSSARELKLTSNGNQNLFPAFSPDGQHVSLQRHA